MRQATAPDGTVRRFCLWERDRGERLAEGRAFGRNWLLAVDRCIVFPQKECFRQTTRTAPDIAGEAIRNLQHREFT